MQELTTERENDQSKAQNCSRAQGWFGLRSMQVGSIVYKGISYTKEGTTVSTKPNPQEGSGGWGGNLAGADTSGGAAHTPPALILSIAKLNFPILRLVLLSLLVKHKIIVRKRQMWKMAKGGNIPVFNTTGGIFLGSG